MDCVIWWRVFVVCTFFFVFLFKLVGFGCLVNYYVIQEVCGYYFLVFDNWKFQFLILILKSGSAPFHFWLFRVLSGMKGWFVMCFLTLQKLPYFFVLVNFCSDFFFCFLFFGLLFCYLHFFLVRSYFDVLVLSSTESFNWLLFLGIFSFNDSFFLVFFYYFVMFLVISYVCSFGVFSFFVLEMVIVFFNVPMSITFFLKVLLFFSSVVFVGFYYLFLLFFMVLMSLSVGYLFFLFSMRVYNIGFKYYDYFFYVLFCVGFFCYL